MVDISLFAKAAHNVAFDEISLVSSLMIREDIIVRVKL